MIDKNFEEGMRWLRQAESDFNSAKYLHKGGFHPESVFHSQQAAEKSLKAVQIQQLEKFDKIHDLLVLAESVKAPDEITRCCIALTPYYTITRYPDVEERITESVAKEMLENSKKVMEWANEKLRQ